MILLRKYLFAFLCIACFSLTNVFAQERSRVVRTDSQPTSQPTQRTNRPLVSSQSSSRPTTTVSTPNRNILTNKIVVVGADRQSPTPLVTKTASSQPVNKMIPNAPKESYSANSMIYGATMQNRLKSAMDSKLGIRYLYGSTGPNSFDCSGLVWQVFQDAGINFERSSARTYWQNFDPVEGADRYKFGTLVFFNHLGHVGIVVDENGFYQASSSKGVTYSSFAGYWEKRVVGFRRVPLYLLPPEILKQIQKGN